MNNVQTQLIQKSRDSYITFSQLSFLSIDEIVQAFEKEAECNHICLPVGTVRVEGAPFWKECQSIAGSDNKSRKLS